MYPGCRFGGAEPVRRHAGQGQQTKHHGCCSLAGAATGFLHARQSANDVHFVFAT